MEGQKTLSPPVPPPGPRTLPSWVQYVSTHRAWFVDIISPGLSMLVCCCFLLLLLLYRHTNLTRPVTSCQVQSGRLGVGIRGGWFIVDASPLIM